MTYPNFYLSALEVSYVKIEFLAGGSINNFWYPSNSKSTFVHEFEQIAKTYQEKAYQALLDFRQIVNPPVTQITDRVHYLAHPALQGLRKELYGSLEGLGWILKNEKYAYFFSPSEI